MDYRQLQFLVALAKEHHFGRAARSCQVTQPTLSARLKQLEEELGCSLVERDRCFKRFTPLGERALNHAWRILKECDALQQVGNGSNKGDMGNVSIPTQRKLCLDIGVVPSALANVVDMPGLKQQALAFRVKEYEMPVLLQLLVEGDIDIAVGYLDSALVLSEEYQVLPLFNERLMVFAAPALAQLPVQPGWNDLARFPHGNLCKGSRLRRTVEEMLGRHRVSVGVRFEADSILALGMMVARGLGIAILPQSFSAPLAKLGLVARELPDADMEAVRIGMIWRKDGRMGLPPEQLIESCQPRATGTMLNDA